MNNEKLPLTYTEIQIFVDENQVYILSICLALAICIL